MLDIAYYISRPKNIAFSFLAGEYSVNQQHFFTEHKEQTNKRDLSFRTFAEFMYHRCVKMNTVHSCCCGLCWTSYHRLSTASVKVTIKCWSVLTIGYFSKLWGRCATVQCVRAFCIVAATHVGSVKGLHKCVHMFQQSLWSFQMIMYLVSTVLYRWYRCSTPRLP